MNKPVRVSAHALLRYLERVGGFGIEGLREQMCQRLAPRVTNIAVQSVLIDGHRFVIRAAESELIVVTVLDKGGPAALHEAGR